MNTYITLNCNLRELLLSVNLADSIRRIVGKHTVTDVAEISKYVYAYTNTVNKLLSLPEVHSDTVIHITELNSITGNIPIQFTINNKDALSLLPKQFLVKLATLTNTKLPPKVTINQLVDSLESRIGRKSFSLEYMSAPNYLHVDLGGYQSLNTTQLDKIINSQVIVNTKSEYELEDFVASILWGVTFFGFIK
jgi:hypothetical protein